MASFRESFRSSVDRGDFVSDGSARACLVSADGAVAVRPGAGGSLSAGRVRNCMGA
jgi:hypothetical protein